MIPARTVWRAAWRGIGAWRWPCLALILLCFCLLPLELGR